MAEKKVTQPFDVIDPQTGEIIPFPKERKRKKLLTRWIKLCIKSGQVDR